MFDLKSLLDASVLPMSAYKMLMISLHKVSKAKLLLSGTFRKMHVDFEFEMKISEIDRF